jgi:hypothetical protein
MNVILPNSIIIKSGIGQIFTALIYPYICHQVFDRNNDVKQLKPFNQEIAKTYGRYIQCLCFSFGLIAISIPDDSKNQSNLAIAFTGLTAAYWGEKVITQMAYYPMHDIPKRRLFKIGSYFLNVLLVLFAVENTLLFIYNSIK